MSNEESVDLRVKRTKRLIRDAFVELLQEKNLNKISVNSLAKRAEINRVTFYLHYKDIHDMMRKIVDELIADIKEILQSIYDDPYDPGYELSTLTVLLEYIAKHSHVYKTFLVYGNLPRFKEKLMDFLYDSIVDVTEEQSQKKIDSFPGMNISKDIAAWYGTSALVGTIAIWLGNDMPYRPKHLAEQLVKLNPFRPEYHEKNI
ncbi:TetR/AcrR family transcriptional regulator [Aquibacillus saliphilus]|uniref:TetR/AcrR family transcriptional regulator n=1 Tax=Aquibacillus saliphilus TaxID=1909422 RepID=UPI001CF05A06|nr:TetR/AcrR family transcriptional regulator [Aquibacillus saliphilus]